MGGTTNALTRWARDPQFYRDRVFRGTVLEIGPGFDPLCRYRDHFPHLDEATCIDHRMQDERYGATWIEGDGTEALGLHPSTYALVYSSHFLEHVWEPSITLSYMWEHVKPGGHLVVMVPSWQHYERLIWPPSKNTDHKTAWVIHLQVNGMPIPFIRGLVNEVGALPYATVLRATTLDDGFRAGPEDQTAGGSCESSLEIVAWKPA